MKIGTSIKMKNVKRSWWERIRWVLKKRYVKERFLWGNFALKSNANWMLSECIFPYRREQSGFNNSRSSSHLAISYHISRKLREDAQIGSDTHWENSRTRNTLLEVVLGSRSESWYDPSVLGWHVIWWWFSILDSDMWYDLHVMWCDIKRHTRHIVCRLIWSDIFDDMEIA
jgi:hypothetical protein